MTTLAENQKKNTFLRWETTLESMRKYVIWNNNPKEENIYFFKNIFEVWKAKMADQSNCRIWQKFSTENIYKGYNFMKIERISEIKAPLVELN